MQGKAFDFEGPLAKGLNTAANIVILSVLTLVCCIPVFTFGPAMRALCAVCLKMVKNEEGYVAKDFFKSFKVNFGRSVGLGIIVLLALTVLTGDIYSIIMIGSAFNIVIKIAMGIAGLIVVLTAIWIFPLHSRFVNPVSQTVKLAFGLVITQFPKTLFMLVIWLFIPACVLFISGNLVPLIFLAELGTAAFFCAKVYEPVFADFEDRINGKGSEKEQENTDGNDENS